MSPRRPTGRLDAAIFDLLNTRVAGAAVQRQLSRNYAVWQMRVLTADLQARTACRIYEIEADLKDADRAEDDPFGGLVAGRRPN